MISLKHVFESEKADGPDPTLIQPSDWNAEHTLLATAKRILARFSPTDGAVEEATIGTGLELTDAGALNCTLVAMPIGIILDWPSNTLPAKWLFCGGQAISRTTYSALFAVIGTTFGAGNGSTTFNVPDARGRVIAGKDDMISAASRLSNAGTGNPGIAGGTLGAAGGVDRHTLTSGQTPSHTHSGTTNSTGAHTHTVGFGQNSDLSDNGSSNAFTTGSGSSRTTSSDGSHSHSFTTNATGGGEAHPNVQPTLVLNKIIYAGV